MYFVEFKKKLHNRGEKMTDKLIRVGTTYIPVKNVRQSSDWYESMLGAKLNYIDEDKAILELADQSFFLVRSSENQTANFIDFYGKERFSLSFEVNGLEALNLLQKEFLNKGIQVGEIEDRGHAGRNFVFQDLNGNKFDVWSELSPKYKRKE